MATSILRRRRFQASRIPKIVRRDYPMALFPIWRVFAMIMALLSTTAGAHLLFYRDIRRATLQTEPVGSPHLQQLPPLLTRQRLRDAISYPNHVVDLGIHHVILVTTLLFFTVRLLYSGTTSPTKADLPKDTPFIALYLILCWLVPGTYRLYHRLLNAWDLQPLGASVFWKAVIIAPFSMPFAFIPKNRLDSWLQKFVGSVDTSGGFRDNTPTLTTEELIYQEEERQRRRQRVKLYLDTSTATSRPIVYRSCDSETWPPGRPWPLLPKSPLARPPVEHPDLLEGYTFDVPPTPIRDRKTQWLPLSERFS